MTLLFPNSLLVRCLSVLFVSSPYTDATARTSKAHLIRSIQLFNRFSLVSNNFRSVATDSFLIVASADKCFVDFSSLPSLLCVELHSKASRNASISVHKSMIPLQLTGLNVKGTIQVLLGLNLSCIHCLFLQFNAFESTQLQNLVNQNNFDSVHELTLEGEITQEVLDVVFSTSFLSIRKLALILNVNKETQLVFPRVLSITKMIVCDCSLKSSSVRSYHDLQRDRHSIDWNIENLVNLTHFKVDSKHLFHFNGVKYLGKLKEVELPLWFEIDGFHPEVVLLTLVLNSPWHNMNSYKQNLSQCLTSTNCDREVLERAPWITPQIVSINITNGLFPTYFMPLLRTLDVFLEEETYFGDHLELDLDHFPLLERLSVRFIDLRLKIFVTRWTNLIKLLLDGTFFKMSDIETILEYSPYLTEVCLDHEMGDHYSLDLRQLDQCLSHVKIIELTRVWIHYNCYPRVRKFVAKKLQLSLDGLDSVFPQVYEMKLTLVKISGSCALTVLREITLIDCHFRDPKLFLSFPHLRVLNASFNNFQQYHHSDQVPLPELSSSIELPPLLEVIKYTGPIAIIRNSLLSSTDHAVIKLTLREKKTNLEDVKQWHSDLMSLKRFTYIQADFNDYDSTWSNQTFSLL
ncbi:hypothetical protein RCL1_005162 [Eukaryota sp. TZLM3-RCL]